MDQSLGAATVRLCATVVVVAAAGTSVAGLSAVATTEPSVSRIVVVTVTDAAALDWFCTSVLTATVAVARLTMGVLTATPLFGTWTGASFASQTFR